MEQWKVIEEFPAYEVSDFGRVRRTIDGPAGRKKGDLLALQPTHDGYRYVRLCSEGKAYNRKVHRLVAQAFLPNPLNLPEVNHVGEKNDDHAGMLEWRSKIGHFRDRAMRDQNGDGVCLFRRTGRWAAGYRLHGKWTRLGYFATFEDAIRARKGALSKLPYIL